MSATAVTYVENYMDCVESLPDDMQRSVSQMLEIDLHYQDKLKDIERLLNNFYKDKDTTSRKRSLFNIKRCLCKTQELGDEKLQVVSQMVDMVDNKSRHIEMDMENLDTVRNDDTPTIFLKQEIAAVLPDEHHILKPMDPPKNNKRNRRPRQPDKPDPVDNISPEKPITDIEKKPDTNKKTTKKKVKSRKKAKTSSPPAEEIPIDPNEPTYCHCNQVSFGEMIGCDNDDCPIEWFHFSCVGLSTKPKGKWYCVNCQAERKKERNSR